MQKRLFIFLFIFFLVESLFITCKQNEDAKLNFDKEDSSFLIRDFSIKAIGEETYTSVPLEKLKDGSYLFTSIDKEIEVRIVSNINLKTVTIEGADVKIDVTFPKIAYGKMQAIDENLKVFKVELVANNGMSQTLNFKTKYAKNQIRG